MPPQAAKWAETLPYHAATIDLLRRGTALSGDTTMVHGDVRTCSRDRKPSERSDHRGTRWQRHAGKSPINQNGKGGANPGHDGKSYMTLVSMRPSPGEVTPRVRGRPERAATPLAHALYTPLSLPPHLPTPGRLFGHGGDIVRAVHRGPPPERSGEGGSSLHGPISAMHRTQRAPFDEKHAHQRRP